MSLWSGLLERIRQQRQRDQRALDRYYLGLQLADETERFVAEMKQVAAEQERADAAKSCSICGLPVSVCRVPDQLITLEEARLAVDLDKVRQAMEMARVAAEQEHPRLWVGFECPGRWAWSVTAPDACLLDSGHGETWAEAIAVGLAALDVASMTAI